MLPLKTPAIEEVTLGNSIVGLPCLLTVPRRVDRSHLLGTQGVLCTSGLVHVIENRYIETYNLAGTIGETPRALQRVLGAPLQKLFGEMFLVFAGKYGGKFGGKFSNPQTNPKDPTVLKTLRDSELLHRSVFTTPAIVTSL